MKGSMGPTLWNEVMPEIMMPQGKSTVNRSGQDLMAGLRSHGSEPVAVIHQAVVAVLVGVSVRQLPAGAMRKTLVGFQQESLVVGARAADNALNHAR